jgi:hypothetical protein
VIFLMNAESASDRQRQWVLVVRRSFEISDVVSSEDARSELIRHFQDQLEENGWDLPTRGIAEPIMDALVALGASGDRDDQLLPTGIDLSASSFTTREAAYRLLEKGLTVVDPEHLVFDSMSELPSEVVSAAQQILDRICAYLRAQPFVD